MIINGKYYASVKIDSPEFKAWQKQCSDEAWQEETSRDYDEYQQRQDTYQPIPLSPVNNIDMRGTT